MSYYFILRCCSTVCLVLCAVGCASSSSSQTDASVSTDGPTDNVDAQSEDRGIVLRFQSSFTVPGSFDDEYQPVLENLAIEVENLRVIGDSAPGDDRTSVDSYVFSFSESPEVIVFPEAPAGNYSRVRGTVSRFFASGLCTHESVSLQWTIEDQPLSGVEMDVELDGVNLDPGGVAIVLVDVDLANPFEKIEWEDVMEQNGVLQIDESYEHLEDLRESIEEVFEDDDDD